MKKIFLVIFFLLFVVSNSFAYIELDVPTTSGKTVTWVQKTVKFVQETGIPTVQYYTSNEFSGSFGEYSKLSDISKNLDAEQLKKIEEASGPLKEKLEEKREKSKALKELEESKKEVEEIKKEQGIATESSANELEAVEKVCDAKKSEVEKQIAEIDKKLAEAEDVSTKQDLEAKKAQIIENSGFNEEACEENKKKLAESFNESKEKLNEKLSKAMEKYSAIKDKLSNLNPKESLKQFQAETAENIVNEEFLPADANLTMEAIGDINRRRKEKLKKSAADAYERAVKLKKFYVDESENGSQAKSMEAYERSQIVDSEPDKANMARISGNTEMMIVAAKEMIKFAKVKTANLRLKLTTEMSTLDYKKKDVREIDYTNYNMYDTYYLSEKEINKRIEEIEKANKANKENKEK